MYKLIGSRHCVGNSPKTNKDYDFYVAYVIQKFSPNFNNGDGWFPLSDRRGRPDIMISEDFLKSISVGQEFETLHFDPYGKIVGGVPANK